MIYVVALMLYIIAFLLALPAIGGYVKGEYWAVQLLKAVSFIAMGIIIILLSSIFIYN